MGKRELVALLNLSTWCLVMVERLFLAVPRGCLRFVIVVFPDHTHLLFLIRPLYRVFPINVQKKSLPSHQVFRLIGIIIQQLLRIICSQSFSIGPIVTRFLHGIEKKEHPRIDPVIKV